MLKTFSGSVFLNRRAAARYHGEPFISGRVGLAVNPGAGTLFTLEPLSDRVPISGGLVVVISTSIQDNDSD
jgi:hypothetical protein